MPINHDNDEKDERGEFIYPRVRAVLDRMSVIKKAAAHALKTTLFDMRDPS